MTSILPSSPASISPTAARSRVGTSWIAASGRPASRRPCGKRGMDGAARAQAVGAAAQDRGIAGFQAQRAGIGGHVRPALIDDADDAERHAHPLDRHAVRSCPGFGDGTDRILEARAPPRCRRPWPRRRPSSSVSRSRKAPVNAAGARLGDVLGIGGQNLGLLRADGGGHAGPARGSSAPARPAPARGRPRGRCGRSRPWLSPWTAISPVPSMLFSGARHGRNVRSRAPIAG